jgi:hypothetical protein
MPAAMLGCGRVRHTEVPGYRDELRRQGYYGSRTSCKTAGNARVLEQEMWRGPTG